MYSGILPVVKTVPALGVHQRLDQAAYRMVGSRFSIMFPSIGNILRFEGYDGPDGLKFKGAQVYPTHYYSPAAGTGQVPALIAASYNGLVRSLRDHDTTRAAFEAAWLAHFICDGMTPPHQYSQQEKIAAYRVPDAPNGYGLTQLRHVRGKNRPERWSNMQAVYQIIASHLWYEIMVAAMLPVVRLPHRYNQDLLAVAKKAGLTNFYRQQAMHIYSQAEYGRFVRRGWDPRSLAVAARVVAPEVVQTIATVWLMADSEAQE